jgi:hypothetical protein
MADNFENFSAPISTASFDGAASLSSSIWSRGGDMAAFTSPQYTTAATESLLSGNNLTTGDTTSIFKQTDATPPVHTTLEQGQQPKITVTSDTSRPADFHVKADGTVEVSGKPFDGNKPLSEYTVSVDKGADPKLTENVVKQIAEDVSKKAPDAKPFLDSETGLVSEDLQKQYQKSTNDGGKENEDSEDIPDGNENGGTDGGGGGGGCDGGGGGGGGGGDDTDMDTDEGGDRNRDDSTDNGRDGEGGDHNRQTLGAQDALRQALATNLDGAGNPNFENGTAKSLGAYSMNFNNFVSSWLTDEMLEELGHPPDWSKLGKIMKKYANDPKFKAKMGEHLDALKQQGDDTSGKAIEGMFDKLANDDQFAKGFGDFMNNQEQGKPATADEMKTYFGKDIQDAAINSKMADVATPMGIKLKDMNEQQAADVSLGMLVGHKVTDSEKAELLKQKMYSDYIDQVRQVYKARKG